jgi:cell wall-associated NlpC family hydrolase
MNQNLIEIVLKTAWRFVGKPYFWGGDDPIKGFDCSGLIVELLKSVGIISRKADFTADGLYHLFKNNEVDIPFRGCLVFWGTKEKLTHVEICIDEHHTIGASGGGSKTITEQDAIQQNAYIKVRPIRNGYLKIVNPFKYK